MTVKWGVFANFSDNGSEFRSVSMRRDASKRCVTAPSAEQSVQTQSTWADANWNWQHAANKHTLSYGLHGNTTQGIFFLSHHSEWSQSESRTSHSLFRLLVRDGHLMQKPTFWCRNLVGALPWRILTSAVCRFVLYISRPESLNLAA